MNINEIDNSITNEELISKVDNMFILLHKAKTLKNLSIVKHKISNDVYLNVNKEIEEDESNNLTHIYDELNVKSTDIINVKIVDNKYVVTMKLVSRSLDYYVSSDTLEYVKGNKDYRNEKINILTVEKSIEAKGMSVVRRCPGCGNSLDVSYNGTCSYCGATFNTEEYDYILTDIKEG